jgi:cleavage and polyadenylation specificity factor subunit 4
MKEDFAGMVLKKMYSFRHDFRFAPFRHGPKCRHKHVKKQVCINWLAGFCPKGPRCEEVSVCFYWLMCLWKSRLNTFAIITDKQGHPLPDLDAIMPNGANHTTNHALNGNAMPLGGGGGGVPGGAGPMPPPVAPRTAESVVRCYECNGFGHMSRDCPRRRR